MISVKHPGKLYVMGEYSVMKTGHSAVLIPVKQSMTASIEDAIITTIETQYGTFSPDEFNTEALVYVKTAYDVANQYLAHKGIEIKPFKLVITSDLDQDGMKYGFGSSGVVIVSVLNAIFKYHALDLDDLTLFKLSVYTQFEMGEVSSGGDLATAVYACPLVYTRYDLTCIHHDIGCVDSVWDALSIQPIDLDFDVFVGWTQAPFKTPHALNHAKQFEMMHPEVYAQRLETAQEIVEQFVEDPSNLYLINEYRHWMCDYQEWTHQEIETECLTTLIETAEYHGFVSKVSGAGGGDCGIAIGKHIHPETLYEAWKKHGIRPVEI